MKTKIKKRLSMLDRFVGNIIIFYLLIIFIGYISILGYYKLFGINVSEYFAIEDYVNIFFNNLIGLVILILIFSLIFFFMLTYLEKEGELKKLGYNFMNTLRIKSNTIGFKNFKTKIKRFSIYMGIFSIILFMIYRFLSNYNFLIAFILFFGGALFFGIIYLMIKLQNFKLAIFQPIHLLLAILIVTLSWAEFYDTFISGLFLLNSKTNRQKMIFNFDAGKSIKTSDSTLYLGSSKGYIFLYSKPGNKAFIYNKSTVKSIESEIDKK